MYSNQERSSYQGADIAIQAAAATPHQLVLMLFDGLQDELVRAKSHIVAKRYEHKAKSINKCIDILNALTSSLDFDRGGELVVNISKIYDFCVYRLYDASNQLSVDFVTEVEQILATLRSGWEAIKDTE
ncbi:flagellar protein FliS [Yersinia rohdei]|uniref:Flagellar secretion chaperone FliS n=1 Tax=Yersinia rohdei TaxID=29485 RepID=A0A0U1HYG6_YERRO|nr:flagellar export chaperone FliS [Yersinia rohdei]AJJ12775.1 flagellar protein FliS [Yersinia rohdei]EEQ00887.1 Flagellin-specific chaperon FliS [Yersinia rohdei ATCC 43380]MDN0096915.1 flagellar export chaperone FliS [Yersinia rohdei]OWF81990.1 flagellar export chaperone FliS [Yersinia rohdei]CQI97427.1 flagellar protein FliS [Yersinia rohdei]